VVGENREHATDEGDDRRCRRRQIKI